MNKFVYQIYYDEQTRSKVLPNFIPLDNTKNERPDWFECWVIKDFLRKNSLENDSWYGFLSPRFYEKTGHTSEYVLQVLDAHPGKYNVALFSPHWDQISYYTNPFEQGEVWHPGLTSLSQSFIDGIGLKINLSTLITDTKSTVYSNYIIAKKEFWEEWLQIAEKFFSHVENNFAFKKKTSYALIENQVPMKTFIQERLATLLLAPGTFRVISPDQSMTAGIFPRLFPPDPNTRRLLQFCDLMKGGFKFEAQRALKIDGTPLKVI